MVSHFGYKVKKEEEGKMSLKAPYVHMETETG